MGWSWLGLLFGLVLPPGLFAAAYFARLRRETIDPRILGLLVVAGAIVGALMAMVFVFQIAPQWTRGVRIVWHGVRSENEPLLIGGDPNEYLVNWPTSVESGKHIGPALSVDTTMGNDAALVISGGDGFIYDEDSGKLLNGAPVPVGQVKPFGKYSIAVDGRTLRHPFSFQLRVLDSKGNQVAAFNLNKDKTRSMQYLLPANLDPDYFTKEKAGERDQIDEWAANIWVLRIDNGQVYVLERTSRNEAKYPLPSQLSLIVRWPNLHLPLTLDLDRQTAAVSFSSPWRFTAPLPPQVVDGCADSRNQQSGDLNVVVTSRPRPCEISLALPFGAKQERVNQKIAIDPNLRKFSSSGAVDNEKELNCPPGTKCEQPRVGLSQITVRQGNHIYGIALAENMPHWRWAAMLLFLAVLFLTWGLWLTSNRIPRTNLWLIYGLVLVVWNFLIFRLLLSFRYALEPSAVDVLAVTGVTRAFFALLFVPGVLLLLTRIRCDHYERPADRAGSSKAFKRTWAYLLGLWFIAFPLGLYVPSRFVWTELPPTYHSVSLNLSAATLGYVFAIWLAPLILLSIYLVKLYGRRPLESTFLMPWNAWSSYHDEESDDLGMESSEDSAGDASEQDRLTFGKVVRALVRAVTRATAVSVLIFSPWRWAEQSHFESTRQPSYWSKTIGGWAGFGRYLALFFFVRGPVFLLTCLVAKLAIPGDKLVQELAVPIFFYWLAIDWIGLALALKARQEIEGSRLELLRVGILAIATITVPAIVFPILLADFGSILPILAIVFPLAAVSLLVVREPFSFVGSSLSQKARNIFSRRTGLALLLSIATLFAAGYLFYENLTGFLNVPVVRDQGRVFARLLNFKYGSQAQRWALTANSIAGGEGVPFQELLNGNQHTWENKAIAHLGGWTGEGFGKAPNRLSQVRQDTLQYDSAFSFFVVSEYGFVGGVLILLLYSVPLLLVLTGAREHFDAGYALAVIVGSSFLLEALYHAGMNWGAFPLTGRNLPLLSVNSPSDLLKWTILLGFVVQTIFWRYRGSGSISDEAESLVPAQHKVGERESIDGVPLRGRQWIAAAGVILIFPFLTFVSVLSSGYSVAKHANQELEAFSYKPLLDDVQWYLDNRVIEYKEQSPGSGRQLVPNVKKLENPDSREFILQEVYRFNARTREAQLQAKNAPLLDMLLNELGNVRDLNGYNTFLENIRKHESSTHRPSLFRLRPVRDEAGAIKDYQIEVNDDFNVRFRFSHQNSPRDLPHLNYADTLIIGPGWINGRYTTLIAPHEDIAQDKTRADLAEPPWIAILADALESEWRTLGSQAARESYQRLTLNQHLQEGAATFVAKKGISLHRDSVARQTQGFDQKLPPRVAISILSLPDGKVQALGGWPRMTSTQSEWKQTRLTIDKESITAWIPSAIWLDEEAPTALERIYEGDRNFERALVMGSITKPLFAAAVMKIHPDLDRLLRVMPSADEENEVFGLRVPGRGWNLNSHSNDWVDFDDYLRYSDNRYHVRTGMLGLADRENDGFKPSPYSGSPFESLNGQNKSWGKEPQFSAAVVIGRERSKGTIQRLNLANTELGKNLHDMYGIGIREQQNWDGRQARSFFYRRSFWTLDERDDDSRFKPKTTWLFDLIAPQAPDFYFDRLTEPRDFISLLLGGLDNRWSNVDLAAAFGSCVTGRPVVAHIIDGNRKARPLEEKAALDSRIAMKLRKGLNQAVEREGGTAHLLWVGNDLAFLKGRIKVYAKTGTLRPAQDLYETSRIAVALIKWKDENKGEVENGLVFTLVAEQGKQGTATRWLKDFIIENKNEIIKLLKL